MEDRIKSPLYLTVPMLNLGKVSFSNILSTIDIMTKLFQDIREIFFLIARILPTLIFDVLYKKTQLNST